jgi:uncharacterized protein (TIGR03067 family)
MPGGPGGPGGQPQPQPQPPPPPPPQPQPQPKMTDADIQELAKFKGAWMPTEGESQGNAIPGQALRFIRWTFDGNRVLVTDGRQRTLAVVTVNVSAKTIDVTAQNGSSSLGIYELSGDTLKICMAAKQRPTDFTTKDVPGGVCYVLKRAQ